MPSTMSPSSVGTSPPWVRTHSATELAAPLRSLMPSSKVDTGHPCLRGEFDPVAPGRVHRACVRAGRTPAWRTRRSSGPPASRRRGWTAAPRRRASAVNARHRHEVRGLPVAQRDGAGLVEQQRVHVARGLHRAARHGQHIALHQAVHAGDADGRQQRADRRRDQADQQRDHHDAGDAVCCRAPDVSGTPGLFILE